VQPSIFALADDLTGALEVGAKFAQHGLPSLVTTEPNQADYETVAVLIVDTETRHLPPDDAAQCIIRLAALAGRFEPSLIYKKTDSTLRGNIAAEFAALQKVFPHADLVYVPAYPEMGRTVRGGHLFVWGTPLHETEFAADAYNPVSSHSIAHLLGDVRARVFDGESHMDVENAVRHILDSPPPHLCAGPAALAHALARHLQPARSTTPIPKLGHPPRCLVINGSRHPRSLEQILHARDAGLFNSHCEYFDAALQSAGMDRALETGSCVKALLAGSHFDALVIFGGDTAFGIHQALGVEPFTSCCELLPGVPLSQSGGRFWITKAGGFGPPDILSSILKKLA
jgi:D-threonate/D-erythronate kinase